MGYQRGNSRYQQSFLSLNDQVSKNSPLRFIDEICEEYCHTVEVDKGIKDTGRYAYHPADLVKIFVYGYFHGISSSRKLERETQRNIEVMWLTSGLCPDHKTISDFRKDNPELIDGLFKYLIARFKEKGLVTGKSIAVDGTKIKAYASKEINVTTIRQKLDDIDQQVEKYLKDMDALDKVEDEVEDLEKKKEVLEKELEQLATKKKEYEELVKGLAEKGEKAVCTIDPNAKMMRSRYGKYWGYNAQATVDTEHHLITAIKVTNNQNDKGLLTPMLEVSEEVTGHKAEEGIADAGYYKINELEKLEEQGTTCYVAINRTQSQVKDQAQGISFTYNQEEDTYHCNENKPLRFWRIKKGEEGRWYKVYRGTECNLCAIRQKCTTAEQRSIHRNENQEWIDSFTAKMNSKSGKEKMVQRRAVAEHPFGTMKYYMGQIPILLRGKKKVQTEMNLYAIGYNLKRYFNIMALENGDSEKSRIGLAA